MYKDKKVNSTGNKHLFFIKKIIDMLETTGMLYILYFL